MLEWDLKAARLPAIPESGDCVEHASAHYVTIFTSFVALQLSDYILWEYSRCFLTLIPEIVILSTFATSLVLFDSATCPTLLPVNIISRTC